MAVTGSLYWFHRVVFFVEPPDVLWVTYANGTQVAKASAGVNTSQNIGYYVGDTVYLICVALGGNFNHGIKHLYFGMISLSSKYCFEFYHEVMFT